MSSSGDDEKEENEEIAMAPVTYKKRSDLGVLLSEATKADDIERITKLILKFKSDIHQIIYFPYEGKLTPMTFFVKKNKFDIVKLLISCGVKVESVPVPGTTLLHTACRFADLNVIQYLVENGADTNALSSSKRTCLMDALTNTAVCTYLLSKGINVNAVDEGGKTALHHAIFPSILDAVKLLISFGADVSIKDHEGVDAFHFSAICKERDIMEYLIQEANVPSNHVANGYCLLEAYFLCENDVKTAEEMLKKALVAEPACDWESSDKPEISEKLCFCKEWTTTQALTFHLKTREHMLNQAFLIYQRILGGHHSKTALCLRKLYQAVVKNGELKRGGDFLLYVYTECLKKNPPLSYDCILAYQQLIKHIFTLPPHDIETTKLLEIFIYLVRHIETANKNLQRWSREKLQYFDRLIVDTVGILITLSNLIKEKSLGEHFSEEIQKLVKNDPRGINNVTVLHTLLNYDWKSLGFTLAKPQRTTELIRTLVGCGASVNATDDRRNTPLHTVLMCHLTPMERLPDQDEVVNYLVTCGTHMDALNSRHQTVIQLMKSSGYSICSVNHVKLQCLAASVIMKHSIPYQGTVPKSMVHFIKMHGKIDWSGKSDWF